MEKFNFWSLVNLIMQKAALLIIFKWIQFSGTIAVDSTMNAQSHNKISAPGSFLITMKSLAEALWCTQTVFLSKLEVFSLDIPCAALWNKVALKCKWYHIWFHESCLVHGLHHVWCLFLLDCTFGKMILPRLKSSRYPSKALQVKSSLESNSKKVLYSWLA